MLGWGVPTLDSHYVFHYLYDTGASWNKANFSNVRVDELIKVMEGEVDLDKRNAAIAEAWQIVKDDITYLPLHHQVIAWASKKNVNVILHLISLLIGILTKLTIWIICFKMHLRQHSITQIGLWRGRLVALLVNYGRRN